MINLLDLLPEYVLHWMVQKGKERRLEKEEALLKEGEKNLSLYIVLDGLFNVYSSAVPNKVLEHSAPGSVLGEVSFFTDRPATATVIAGEPSLVLELPKAILRDKLDHDHGYAADLYKALLISVSDRLRDTGVKLYAAEGVGAQDLLRDPTVRKAQEGIDAFKVLMVQLDKEAIKNGSTSEEGYQRLFGESARLMRLCHEVLGSTSPLSDVVKQQIGSRLQHEMLPYVLTTETADRFYSKPRGYAGDYLAIHRIYQNEAGGTGRVGPLVDRMFLETPPSKAVRNRRALLASEIVATVKGKPERPVKVLCMASGPATEVFDAFAVLEDKGRLKATLMDIDLQALAFVDEVRTRRKLHNQVTLVNENLIALYLGRGKTTVEPQDLIYSIGLIDYLNDKLVNKLLQYVYENLVPGGRVILGNFHPQNPAKEFMDYVLEWNLIHRTEEDMDRLFLNSAFKRKSSRIQFEEEGVNLFAECVKEQ
jgi:extracellular factor (EF) 3-hydroxypalmitic acid methyl ester biosynthesis protein